MTLPDKQASKTPEGILQQNLPKQLLLFTGLALALWLSLQFFVLPKEMPLTADPTVFSAVRSSQHLEHIASHPRPVGSTGHSQTRKYLLQELQKMGLTPEVQQTTSLLRFPNSPVFSAGNIKNVIVRIPGKNSSGAIALDAHYDGASTGPAAADCGSGVVVLLESIRAILASPQLDNDLIFVFADAEEVGDLGAHAFASQHPWMRDVRMALNYEAMGTGGPAYLYASSKGNSKIIKAFAKASPPALANSFIVGIFNLVPEQRLACDLQDYMDEGSAGYGFVFTGNISAYHTILDNIESLDLNTVQQLGESTMALLNHLGNTDLNNLHSNTDEVFFTIWPGKLVRYPASWSFPLAVVGFILLLIVIGLNIRRRALSPWKVGIAVSGFLLSILLAVVVAGGVWYGLKTVNSNLTAFIIGNWAVEWFFIGLLLLSATFMVIVFNFLKSRISTAHLLAGALLGFSLLSILFGAIYPVGNYLFLWPVFFGLPSLWILLRKDRSDFSWAVVLAMLLTAVPTIILIVPLMLGANPFVGLLIRLDALTGMPVLALGAFFSAVLAGLFVPLFAILNNYDSQKLKRISWFGLTITLIILIIGWTKSGFNEDRPHPESIRYELDVNQEKAYWVSGDRRLGEWTTQFISLTDTTADYQSILPNWPITFAAPAPVSELLPPTLETIKDTTSQAIRTIQLRLKTQRKASLLSVRIETPDTLITAQIEGRSFDLTNYDLAGTGVLQFNYIACPPEGIELSLTTKGTGPIRVSLVDMKMGLPQMLQQARLERPASTMPSPLGADCTVVRNVIKI
jgi:hypothetical protein